MQQVSFTDDQIIIKQTHDVTPTLQRAEMLRQHGGKMGESQLLGTIDMSLLSKIMKDRGVKWDDKEARNDIVMMMLRSRDYSKFKVYEGNH